MFEAAAQQSMAKHEYWQSAAAQDLQNTDKHVCNITTHAGLYT